MYDDLERLRECPELVALLGHYAAGAVPDRQTWQDRVMQLGELAPRELTGLHGELLAFGWIEQNTGAPPATRKGTVPGCYRVTPAGLRALKQWREGEGEE